MGVGSVRIKIHTERVTTALVSTDGTDRSGTAEHHASTTVPYMGVHGTICETR
jgi:hypothetical protein